MGQGYKEMCDMPTAFVFWSTGPWPAVCHSNMPPSSQPTPAPKCPGLATHSSVHKLPHSKSPARAFINSPVTEHPTGQHPRSQAKPAGVKEDNPSRQTNLAAGMAAGKDAGTCWDRLGNSMTWPSATGCRGAAGEK